MPIKPLPNKHGRLTRYITTDPVAGTQIDLGLLTNVRRRLITVRCTLVTDATAVNRSVYLALLFGGTEIVRLVSGVLQTATQTINYNFSSGGPDRTTAFNNEVMVGMPNELWVNDSFTAEINAINLQAGDNFSTALQMVEEWIEE